MVRPYGKESALNKLGVTSGYLQKSVTPYIEKAMRDKKQMNDLLQEYTERAKSGRAKNNSGMVKQTAVSSNPEDVLSFAKNGVFGKGTLSDNAVFGKMPDNHYAVFFADIDGRPSKEFVTDTLKSHNIEIISRQDMKKLAGA